VSTTGGAVAQPGIGPPQPLAFVAKLPITLAWQRFVVRRKFKVPAVGIIVSAEIKVHAGIRQQIAISVSVFRAGARALLVPPQYMTLVTEPPVALFRHFGNPQL
jgi:hypothetical protein